MFTHCVGVCDKFFANPKLLTILRMINVTLVRYKNPKLLTLRGIFVSVQYKKLTLLTLSGIFVTLLYRIPMMLLTYMWFLWQVSTTRSPMPLTFVWELLCDTSPVQKSFLASHICTGFLCKSCMILVWTSHEYMIRKLREPTMAVLLSLTGWWKSEAAKKVEGAKKVGTYSSCLAMKKGWQTTINHNEAAIPFNASIVLFYWCCCKEQMHSLLASSSAFSNHSQYQWHDRPRCC